MSTTARTSSVAGEAEQAESQPLLAKGMLVLFIALIACFTAWGVAQDLTTPMVAGFKRIFDMSTFQASLVQLAYFGGQTYRQVAETLGIPEGTAKSRLRLALRRIADTLEAEGGEW